MNSGKLTCNMVNDMLPLYVDNVLSEESKTAVIEHLAKCKKCQQTAKDMNAELGSSSTIADIDNSLFKQVQRKFRKKYFTWVARIIVLFLAISSLLLINIFSFLKYSSKSSGWQVKYTLGFFSTFPLFFDATAKTAITFSPSECFYNGSSMFSGF